MSRAGRITVTGCLAVVIFDMAASLLSRMTHLPYESARYGSDLIYASVAFFIIFERPLNRFRLVVLPALALGLTDASLGWFASWLIGPGKPPRQLTPALWVFVAMMVMTISLLWAVFGYCVAWIVRRFKPS